MEMIEDALGADAESVLPPSARLADLHVRIPRYHIAMLQHFAERERTTVSDLLTRELDGLASARAGELSPSIVGFGTALRWPDAEDAQLPC